METTLFYGSPRSIKIGDIFYVIDTRERRDFSSPCRVCNDEKKLTINGITFDCPVCGGYRPRETVVEVQHFTVATVKVYVIKQEVSTDYWGDTKLSRFTISGISKTRTRIQRRRQQFYSRFYVERHKKQSKQTPRRRVFANIFARRIFCP